jgi:hypothetical protein
MAINLTDSLNAATTKGKLGDAKQMYLNGDTKNLQQAYEETNTHLSTLDNRSTQMEKAIQDISATGGASTANAVSYNNNTSKLEAVNLQGAIDEVSSINHFAKRGSVINISTNYNSSNTAEVLTLSQAIGKVPSEDRTLGFCGRFLSEEGWNFITFNGDSLSEWRNDFCWESIPLTDKNINLLNALLQFENNVKKGEYYNPSGFVDKDPSDVYRRFPIIPCNSSLVLHSLPYSGGAFKTYNENMEYISGGDVELINENKEDTVVYTFKSNVKYVGLYWRKSTDDYSNTYLDINSGPINHIYEKTSNKEKIQETLTKNEVKLSNCWSIGEDVIYSAYYDSLGNFVQDASTLRYRCLPVLNTKDPFYIKIEGNFCTVRFQNAEGLIIGNKSATRGFHNTYPTRIVPPAGCVKCLIYWQKREDDYSDSCIYNDSYSIQHKIDFVISDNVYMKDTCTKGYIDKDGSVVDYPLYHTTDFIPIKAGKPISASPRVRKALMFTDEKTLIESTYTDDMINPTFVPEQDGFIRISLYNSDRDDDLIQIKYSENITGYTAPGILIPNLYTGIDKITKNTKDITNLELSLGKLDKYIIYDSYYDTQGIAILDKSKVYRRLPLIDVRGRSNLSYSINGNYIGIRCFDKEKAFLGSATNTATFATLLEKTVYVGFYWQKFEKEDYSNDYISLSSNIISRLDNSIKKINNGNPTTISISNSDKIAIIGDSYTESHYTVKNKAYINKLSLFSDYEFVNWGISGDTYIGRLSDIRYGVNRYNTLPFEDIAPKYAMMCCFTNDTSYMGVDAYIDSLDNICTVLQGLGVEPIICTEYHTNDNSESNTSVKTALLNYAIEHNYLFFDIATYCDILRPKSFDSHYRPFWGGSHAGTRTNAIEADPYEMYLKGLERPEKSIKLFRLRGENYSSLDSLLFRTNIERAEKFQEINVGHTHIIDPSLVDNCSSAKQTVQTDEYQNIQKGVEVNFGNVCLASVTLPYLAKNISRVSIKVKNTGEISKVYVLNRLIKPYNNCTRYTRFDYTSITEKPSVGDTYTSSNDGNTQVFTVQKVVENMGDAGSLGSIFCTPSNSSTNSGGTLTKVTGNGDSSIPYSYRSIGYDSSDIIKDTAGHWEEIALSDGEYVVTSPNTSIDLDKVHLLLIGTNIGISDITITCYGSGTKLYNRRQVSLNYNRNNPNNELLPSSTFAPVGTQDSNWNNVTTSDIYEHTKGTDSYPTGCSSIVKVSDKVSLKCSVNKSLLKECTNLAYLEIWCRYFPPIYSDGSGTQITESSYDYNNLYIKVGKKNKSIVTVNELVNTYWKIVRVPIIIDDNTENINIEVGSNSKGIEIAYISLKYNN